jgi:hypothetical protein
MSQPRKYKSRLSAITTAKMVAPSAPVTIKASAAEGEHAGPPTFQAVAYAGERVPGATSSPRLDADYVIDLAGMTAAKNPKVNLDHKATQRVGHLTSHENDGKQLTVTGVLSAGTSHRDEVVKSAADGYAWEVSIEANLSKPRKLAAGKTAVVNGRTETGPLYIFGKSVLTDLGFVSHGASEGNEVRIAASAAGVPTMNEFEKFAAKLGIDLESATDAVKANLQALFDAQQGAPAKVRSSLAEIADAQKKENERCEQIRTICLAAMKDHPMYIEQIKSLGELAEAKLTSPDMFELELIRATRSKAGQFRAQMQGTQSDPKVIEAALAMASGLPNIEKHYSEATLDAVDRAGMRNNFSIQRCLLQTAQGNGYSCGVGERVGVGNIRSILEYAFPPAVARLSGFSTVSLPNILGAVANKQILAGYMEEDNSWREFAEIKSVSNFYTQNHYRMLDSMEYEEVGSGGELKHGTLGEETYTSQAKTWGKMLAVTRTQIINDDLGAFNDLRTRLGRGAAKKFGNVFWAAFMNNGSFFTTALTNYIEGATTNLGIDGVGLGLGVKAFRKMTSPSADGTKRVGITATPRKLLVPPELEQIADALYRNNNMGQVAGSSANTFAGKYRPIVQNRLSETAFTGNSSTAWYLFGDEMMPMLVTFLNGQQSPTVESTDADFSVLGIQFRGYHDFGCDKSEYLAGLKSKGAT